MYCGLLKALSILNGPGEKIIFSQMNVDYEILHMVVCVEMMLLFCMMWS